MVSLKNIERMRVKGKVIRKEWLVPELYGFQVPLAVLKGLALSAPFETVQTTTKSNKRTIPAEELNSDFNQLEPQRISVQVDTFGSP